MTIGMYAKAVVAALAAAAVTAQTAVSHSGGLTAQDWANIAVAAIGVLAVYVVPNLPPSTPAVSVAASSPMVRTDKQLLGGDAP